MITDERRLIVRQVQRSVSDRITQRRADNEAAGLPRMAPDAEQAWAQELIYDQLEQLARERIAQGLEALSGDAEDDLARRVASQLFGLRDFDPWLADTSIENIFANGFDNVWVVHSDGRRRQVEPVGESDDDLIELVKTAAARMGRTERRFDVGNPFVNLRLPDGSRLHAVMEISGRPSVSIRRHRHVKVTLGDLLGLGSLDRALTSFLDAAVKARFNLVVCGGTNVGKTTLLRAMINAIPSDERLVTVEDSLELNLEADPETHPNVVEFETREANVEGRGAITMEELTRQALRMAPDRVIVGEVRGGEVVYMLDALSQGNAGSMCTIHANSSQTAFSKIAAYALRSSERLPIEATNLMIANSLNFVVHLNRLGDGRRVVSSVREVTGADGQMVISNEVFAPDHLGRACPHTPLQTASLRSLTEHGFEEGLMYNAAGWWDR